MITELGYKVLHLSGVFLVLLSLGSLIVMAAVGDRTMKWKGLFSALNGIGLLLIVVAGFGLLARLGVSWPWQGWVFLKMMVWLFFGASLTMVDRLRERALLLWWIALAAVIFSAYLGVFKPF